MQSEIHERAEFLDTMTKLGKRKEYQAIIMTEISQVTSYSIKNETEILEFHIYII